MVLLKDSVVPNAVGKLIHLKFKRYLQSIFRLSRDELAFYLKVLCIFINVINTLLFDINIYVKQKMQIIS